MPKALLIFCVLGLCTFFASPLQLYSQESTVEQEYFLEQPPAADGAGEESAAGRQIIDVRNLFFKTLVLLVGLCGLVIAGAYLLKRLTGGRLSSFSTDGSIVLLERKYLSPKSSLWLLEVKGRPLVVVDSLYGVAIHSLENAPKEFSSSLSKPHREST